MYSKLTLKTASGLRWSLGCSCMCTLLLLASGCGAPPVEVLGDEQQAKAAVTEMLDAWQVGTTLSEFTAAHPDVVVADEDWQVGVALKYYTIGEPAKLNGSHWRQRVELHFANRSKAPTATVYYAVTLSDKTVILRSDFNY